MNVLDILDSRDRHGSCGLCLTKLETRPLERATIASVNSLKINMILKSVHLDHALTPADCEVGTKLS